MSCRSEAKPPKKVLVNMKLTSRRHTRKMLASRRTNALSRACLISVGHGFFLRMSIVIVSSQHFAQASMTPPQVIEVGNPFMLQLLWSRD